MIEHSDHEKMGFDVLLLAAGEGSRLRPLTEHVPKPLLPIDGNAVISTLIEQLDSLLQPSDATIVVGHLGAMLERHVQNLHDRNDSPRFKDASLRFPLQEPRLGSAHALQVALEAGHPQTTTLVAATDTVFRASDLAELMNVHIREQPLVTMGARRWPISELPHRSALDLSEDMKVKRVIEKPRADSFDADNADATALSGSPIYVFSPDFWSYITALPAGDHGLFELATALQNAINDGHVVRAVEVHDTRDLTRPDDLLRHNFDYLNKLLTRSKI